MAKQINNIYIGRINNGAHFVFVDDVATRAEANPTLMAKCPTQVNALRNAVTKEDECLKISTKSFHSDKIAEGDQKRGFYYSGYRKAVKGFLNAPLPEMVDAAVILDQQMTDFDIDPQMQIDRETGMMTNFISDLESKYAAQVATLGLTAFVTAMKEANDMVRVNKVERREERAGSITGAMKDARKASEDAYYNLVLFANAIHLLDGNADTEAFVDYVNALIAEYKREVIGVSADSPNASDNENSTPSTDGTGSETPDTGGSDTDGGEDSGSGTDGSEDGGSDSGSSDSGGDDYDDGGSLVG